MKKRLIRIIKRKDVEETLSLSKLMLNDRKAISSGTPEGNESLRLREIDSTVSSWIAESRRNNQMETDATVRKMLKGENLFATS